jgi:hypothetical protein
MTELLADSPAAVAMTIREMVEGQTAAHLVLAADDYSWWSDMLAGRTVRPDSGIETIVADGLVRCGLLAPLPQDGVLLTLTDAGREVARARGFLRVVARGWEPTFRQLADCRNDAFIPGENRPGPGGVRRRRDRRAAARHPQREIEIFARYRDRLGQDGNDMAAIVLRLGRGHLGRP